MSLGPIGLAERVQEAKQGILARFDETRRARLHYWFENFVSKGGRNIFASLVVLFVLCYLFILILRILVIIAYGGLDDLDPNKNNQDTWWGHLYIIFLEMTDPGNMNQDIRTLPGYKLPAMVGGVLGVIIFSMLIAFITTSLDQLLNDLKRGHSRVLENDQTLILGWNERIPDILKELILANESESYASVVILADEEKEMMDAEIDAYISDPMSTRIVTRSGTTSAMVNLERVNACEAKSVIILATCSEGATREEKQVSDSTVIKTILAVTKCQEGENRINIVAEIFSENKRELIRYFKSDLIQSMDTNEILGKLMVQTSRTHGLAMVYNEMISFDGAELYFHEADWGGKKFYDIAFHFEDGVPLGLMRTDGELIVRPEDPELLMETGDRVLILAEDDSTIRFRRRPVAHPRDIKLKEKRLEKRVERQLILGWHATAPIIISEFATYLHHGSHIDIVINQPSEQMADIVVGLMERNPTLNINLLNRNPVHLKDLIRLKPFTYNNVIILSMSEGKSHPEKVDSETITILFMLRRIAEELEPRDDQTAILTQVMNSENQELIARTEVDDFIISNKMVSMIFAQLSEEPNIRRVYDQFFKKGGSEIYLKPAPLYFEKLPTKVTFADMMALVNKREEICLGIRLDKHRTDPDRNFGIKLIPKKTQEFTLKAKDRLVVLATDEL